MINLFKKREPTPHQELFTVEQIHHEFDTSSVILLNQENTASRLKRLGFVNSEVVKKAEQANNIATPEEIELIKYYQQTYPFQKFLLENELDRICKKYNLVYAPVSSYLKDVPEENIKEIENARELIVGDIVSEKLWCDIDYGKEYSAMGFPKTIHGYNFKANTYEAADYIMNKYKHIYVVPHQYGFIRWAYNYVQKLDGLFICAPQSHFNLDGLTKNGLSFSKISKKIFRPTSNDEDPIVFRYCRGGVQILSKWGLEASDESLINPITN